MKSPKSPNSALVFYSPACKKKKTYICFFLFILKNLFKTGARLGDLGDRPTTNKNTDINNNYYHFCFGLLVSNAYIIFS